MDEDESGYTLLDYTTAALAAVAIVLMALALIVSGA